MKLIQHLLQQAPPLAIDIFRLCAWLALLMATFVPLERLCGVHARRVFRKAFRTDLGYYFLNSLLPKLILIVPMSIIARGLHFLAPNALYSSVAAMPLSARMAGAMLVGEFGAYWGHRWMHEFPGLWRFHAIHHSAEEMDWLVNTRAHPVDICFTRLCALIPMYVLGFAQPTANTTDVVPLLIAVAGTLWSFFIHANLRWRFGWVEWLVSTPAFHHWHHTNDGREYINKNYAATLPCMDMLFGTFYLPSARWPKKCGIDAPVAASLAGQLLQPFMHHSKPARALDEPPSIAKMLD